MAGYGSGNFGARLFGFDGTVKDASAQVTASSSFASVALAVFDAASTVSAVSSASATAEKKFLASASITATGTMATLGVKNASASTTISPQLTLTTDSLRIRQPVLLKLLHHLVQHVLAVTLLPGLHNVFQPQALHALLRLFLKTEEVFLRCRSFLPMGKKQQAAAQLLQLVQQQLHLRDTNGLTHLNRQPYGQKHLIHLRLGQKQIT